MIADRAEEIDPASSLDRPAGGRGGVAFAVAVLIVGIAIACLCVAIGWEDRRIGWDQTDYQIQALQIRDELAQASPASWPRTLWQAVIRHSSLRPPVFVLSVVALGVVRPGDLGACVLIAAALALPCLGLALFAASRSLGLDPSWSALAALAGMSMPAMLEFATLATPDVLVAAAVLWVWTTTLVWFRRPRPAAALALGVAAGAAMMTKATAAVFVGPAVLAAVALLPWRSRGTSVATVAGHAALATLGGVIVAGPWYAWHWRTVLKVVRWTAESTHMEPSMLEDPWARIRLCAELLLPGAGYWTWALLLAVPLALRGMRRSGLASPGARELLVLLAGPVAAFVSMALTRSEPRYYLPLLPPLCVLAAFGLRLLPRRGTRIAALVVVASCVVQLAGTASFHRRAQQRLCFPPDDRLDRRVFEHLPLAPGSRVEFTAVYHDFNPMLLRLHATEQGWAVDASLRRVDAPSAAAGARGAPPDFVVDIERRCAGGMYAAVNRAADGRRSALDLGSPSWEPVWERRTGAGTRVSFFRNAAAPR